MGMRILANFLDYKREPFAFRPLLERVMGGAPLAMEQAAELMDEVTEGRLPAAQLAAILVALGVKGYTAEEIAGCASVLARKKQPLERGAAGGPVVDTCGTGGDGLATFNISSLAALAVAACGVRVAKHGNRGVSSPTGSADLFAALGVDTSLSPAQAAGVLERTGFAFPVRPHLPRRHAPRRPGARRAGHQDGAQPARAAGQPGGRRVPAHRRVRRGAVRTDGARRPPAGSAAGAGRTRRRRPGRGVGDRADPHGGDRRGRRVPRERVRSGVVRHRAGSLDELAGGDAEHNAALARELLAGGGPLALRDAVAVNAGAALYVAGAAPDIAAGYRRARTVLEDGTAAAKLQAVVTATRDLLAAPPEPAPAATGDGAPTGAAPAGAGTPGAGTPDAGASDAGTPGAGTSGAGAPDAGAPSAGARQ